MVSKGCFLEALKYLKTSKQHHFVTPGDYLLHALLARSSNEVVHWQMCRARTAARQWGRGSTAFDVFFFFFLGGGGTEFIERTFFLGVCGFTCGCFFPD